VAFGEAVRQGVLPVALINQLYVVVALTMALVPYLAALGAKLGQMFEKGDMKVGGSGGAAAAAAAAAAAGCCGPGCPGSEVCAGAACWSR
jgi:hypothetical protein